LVSRPKDLEVDARLDASHRRLVPQRLRAPTKSVGLTRRADGWSLKLPYHPPLDWESLLAFLATRAVPGVEVVEGDRYRRTIRTAAGPGLLDVTPASEGGALLLRIDAPQGPGLDRIVRRVRRLFDLDTDPVRIGRDLARDPLLAPAVRTHPGLRVPGAWDGFETAIRAVLGQQVSVRGATTTAGRLVAALGTRIPSKAEGLTHLFPEPADLARSDSSRLGLPRARARCLVSLARSVESGSLQLEHATSLEEAVSRLTSLPGVGPWTAHYIAMRALGEPDAFPAGDLVLRRQVGLSEARLRLRAERWRPWRAYATMYLWRRSADAASESKPSRRQRRLK
jgi:AraC family transcriptional regulator, regulatory protein of adaptative response / DNA-3-methyladenine glycosylase II